MKTDNRKKTSDSPACGAGEKPVIAKGRRVGGEVTQRIAKPHGEPGLTDCKDFANQPPACSDNSARQTGNASEILTTGFPGALTTHTRYMPSSQEEDYDYGPPWWIAPAIAGGAMVFTLIVLWLAGVL